MPSGNTTIKSRVNPSKFMGSAHAAGEELEERVSNNERKITLIKNILNYQDSLLPIPKPEEDDGGDDSSNLNIADRLDNIGDALGVIGGLFKLQLRALQDEEEQDRKAKADQDRRDREAELEAKKATKSKKKTPLQKGALGFFDRLKKFFLNIAIGAAVLKAIKWLKDPENAAKVEKFTKWLEENAGAIFKTLGALVALNVVGTIINIFTPLGLLVKWLLTIIAGIVGAPAWVLGIILGVGGLGIKAFTDVLFGLREGEQRRRRLTVEEGWKKTDGTPNYWGRNDYHGFLKHREVNLDHPYWKNVTYEDHLKYRGLTFEGKKLEGGRVPFSELKSLSGIEAPPGFAKGGRPPVGELLTVGEKGRELFVADRSGTIVSNDKTEHVFDGGAILVAKSNTLDKISNTSSIVAKSDTLSNKSSSISQRVNNKHGSSKIIDLRGGQQKGSMLTAGNATTGNQIEGVSSVFPGDILVKAAQVQLGLVG